MSDSAGDVFAHADAAYVLGALDAHETAQFEAHLLTCPACQERVADARATVALLGKADLPFTDAPVADEPVADLPFADEPPPDTLLPGLLARARRERRQRHTLVAGIAAIAAACLVAVVVAVRPGAPADPASPPAQALRALAPASFVTATAALRPRSWGTEIDVRCKYARAQAGADRDAHTYGLRVIDRRGRAHGAGSWTQSGEDTVVFTGGTQVRRERIAKVQVTLADGTPILQLVL